MSIRTQYEFLFVGRDEGSFVENYAYDLGESGENSGKIFINLEIQNNPAEAEAIGETLFDAIRKSFFADLEQDPYVRFEDAVRMANKALFEMKSEKKSGYLGNLHTVIAAVVGNTLFLTQTGDAEAYLIRRRLCTTVTEGLEEESPNETFTNIASGTLEPGDFLLLSSTRLLRYISKNDLAKTCGNHNLVGSLSELKEYLMTEVLGKVGIIGLTAHESAPSLSDMEKGQIVSHLREEGDAGGAGGSGMGGGGRKKVGAEKGGRYGAAGGALMSMKELVGQTLDVLKDVRQQLRTRRGAAKGGTSGGADTSRTRTLRGTAFADIGKERLVVLIVIGILLLVLSVWWLRTKASEAEMLSRYETMLSEVQEEIASAETTGQFNKDQAGQMLVHAESQALEVLNSGLFRDKANELLLKVQESRDSLDGVLRPEVTLVADLAQKRSNVSALGILSHDNILYAYEYNALYPIISDQVQDPLTIDDNETVVAATVYEDTDSLLFYTKSGKLIEYKDNRMTFVDTADGLYKNGVAIEAYSNKFYVLDPENNQIWRYTRRRDSFDGAEEWNVNADLAGGTDIAIDGNIYVLKGDGNIVKVFSGNQENFPVKKSPITAPSQPTRIFTELDLNRIFVLEPLERRVLVYYKDDKTGGVTYETQLVFDDSVGELRDLFFDKDTNRLYLIDTSKVYAVSL